MNTDDFEIRVRSKGYVKIPVEGDLFVEHEHVKGVDYSSLGLKGFGSHGSRFEDCNFSRLQLDSLSFGDGEVMSEYINCTFDGSRFFSNTLLGRSRFVNCSFRSIRSSRFQLSAGDLIDCVFSGRMDSTQIWGRTGPDARIYGDRTNTIDGNDFSGVDFGDTDFRSGVDLRKQILPTGPDYMIIPDAAQVLARAYENAATLDDLESRSSLIRMIERRQEAVSNGQRDLFESKRRIPKHIRGDYERFFDLVAKQL
ncbi:hypothetical protein [Arthrobacter bambusae]|uniref:hypothetical protein n=1 Tax=Arthrobacter bambusae TaxID=1338426 RepID=UPI0027811480|nr:hypothetical protein [Arthrobacter bambusae]MDQ0238924.1 hypothetical protein [Arthrobacter bambusae]